MTSQLLLTLLFLWIIVSPVTQAGDDDWLRLCDSVSELAETIMQKRQDGFSMKEMMKLANDPNYPFAQKLVIEAFKQPRFYTKDVQRRVIEEFRDEVYLGCAIAVHEKSQERTRK